MSNEAQIKYAAMPERLYIVQNGKIVYEGGPGPICYDIHEMVKVLQILI